MAVDTNRQRGNRRPGFGLGSMVATSVALVLSGVGPCNHSHHDTGPAKITAEQTDSGPPSQFKTCHGMSTHATLFRKLKPPRVIASTKIWSHCWVGGFTGTAAVLIGDADGDMLADLPAGESWGVNGLAESGAGGGPSDRLIAWQVNVEDRSVLRLARTLSIVNSPAPRNRVLDILSQAVATGKKLIAVAAEIAALTE